MPYFFSQFFYCTEGNNTTLNFFVSSTFLRKQLTSIADPSYLSQQQINILQKIQHMSGSLKKLAIGAGGIYVSYLLLSIIAERLYSVKYPSIVDPEKSHKFKHPGLFVWFSCLLCALAGFARSKLTKERPNPIILREQVILGFLNTANILAANTALLYITFLQKVVGGNLRYLLVVLIGAFFSRVKKDNPLKIGPKKVLVALVITVGVLMFSILGATKKKQESHIDPDLMWKGFLFMLISVFSDAMFSDSQAYSKANFRPTANHLFTSANLFAFIFVLGSACFTGEIYKQIRFCYRHPTVIIDILLVSILQVVGQISIYYVVANFKQHMWPLISTTRKVMTILLSIYIYNHKIVPLQWLSIILIFGGLIYEVIDEISEKAHKQKKLQNEPKKANQLKQQTNQEEKRDSHEKKYK